MRIDLYGHLPKGSPLARVLTWRSRLRRWAFGFYNLNRDGSRDYIPPGWLSKAKWKLFTLCPRILRRWPHVHTWPQRRIPSGGRR